MVFHVLGVMQGLEETAAEPNASTRTPAGAERDAAETTPEADDQAAEPSED